jgi:hypothetical protein
MNRVGIAFTREINGRRSEYGVYESDPIAYGFPVPQSLYVRYEGYREGNVMVGLALAGPNAAHLQPFGPFNPNSFEEVRFFE